MNCVLPHHPTTNKINNKNNHMKLNVGPTCNPLRLQSMELSWIYQSASNSRGEDKKTSGPKSCSLPNHQKWGPQSFPRSMCCLSESPNHHQQEEDLILLYTYTCSILVTMPMPATFLLAWPCFFSMVSLCSPLH